MSAPSTVYSSLTYEDKKDGNNNQVLTYLPLALTEYKVNPSSTSETVATTDAHFCELFFCHNVFKTQDADGNTCVMGLLDPNNHNTSHKGVSGVDYNLLHNLNPVTSGGQVVRPGRQGYGRVTIGGTNYIILNDGGLNTKPWCTLGNIDLCAQNCLIFHMDYQNAYYTKTTGAFAVVERLQQRGGQWVVGNTRQVSLTELNKGRKVYESDFYITIYEGIMYELNPDIGDKIRVTIKMYNEETGSERDANASPFVSNSLEATVEEAICFFNVQKVPDENTLTGTPYILMLRRSDFLPGPEDGEKTLCDIFWTEYNAANPSASVARYEGHRPQYDYSSEPPIHGIAGTEVTASILTHIADQGYYYALPGFWPGLFDVDPGVQNPENKLINIDNISGHATAYWTKTTPTPTPTDPGQISAMSCTIVIQGDNKSIATLSDNMYSVYINPDVVITGKATVDFEVQLQRLYGDPLNAQDEDWFDVGDPVSFHDYINHSTSSDEPKHYTVEGGMLDNYTMQPDEYTDHLHYRVKVISNTTANREIPNTNPINPITSSTIDLETLYQNAQSR